MIITDKFLRDIVDDYWDYNEETKKYKLTVEQVFQKYNLEELVGKPRNIGKFLFEKDFGRFVKICDFCDEAVSQKSRSDNNPECNCNFTGWCKACEKPYKRFCCAELDGVGYLCLPCWVTQYNTDRDFLEGKADKNLMTDEEEILLNLLKFHSEDILTNNSIDFVKISFILKRSTDYARKIFKSVVDKGFIWRRARLEDERGIFYSIGAVTIPITDRILISKIDCGMS